MLACNQAPDGLEVSLTPAAPSTLDELVVVFDSQATDANDDQITYHYTWTVDGGRTEHDGELMASGETRKGQLWQVRVIATDGKQPGIPAIAEVTVVNTPPTADVRLTPEVPRTADPLKVEADLNDIDRDTVAVTYSWSLNGSVVSIREPEVRPTRTSKGDVWEVTVTPSDDEVDGEPVVVSVTIANTPPTADKAVIEPQAPDRTSVLRCEGVGWQDADDDDEDWLVQWKVDGAPVSVERTLAVAPYVRGSKVVCILSPFDGEDAGEPHTSNEVQVRNTPPSIGSVAIGPEDPLIEDDVSATLTGEVDLDSDDIELEY
ncbi:MAG: hypothetical protein ACI9MC_003493, partial [Kiritimatiellia bacterium]